MFFPYRDDNPSILFPYVTYAIIATSVLVFLFQFYLAGNNPELGGQLVHHFGFTPSKLNPLPIFTSMFLHGGFFHLIGNMWFLYIFGDNVESILGHVKYFLFYLVCGFGAALVQFLVDPNSSIPMIGASGAIAGVLGAYMVRFPRARVHVFVFIFVFFTTIYVPAQIVLGLWFLMQLTSGLNSLGLNTTGGVAWFAHVGGFIVGLFALKYFQQLRIEKS